MPAMLLSTSPLSTRVGFLLSATKLCGWGMVLLSPGQGPRFPSAVSVVFPRFSHRLSSLPLSSLTPLCGAMAPGVRVSHSSRLRIGPAGRGPAGR